MFRRGRKGGGREREVEREKEREGGREGRGGREGEVEEDLEREEGRKRRRAERSTERKKHCLTIFLPARVSIPL